MPGSGAGVGERKREWSASPSTELRVKSQDSLFPHGKNEQLIISFTDNKTTQRKTPNVRAGQVQKDSSSVSAEPLYEYKFHLAKVSLLHLVNKIWMSDNKEIYP